MVCNNLDTRTHFSNELLNEVDKFHGAILIETYISNTVRLKEAAAKGVSIFELERSSKAAKQFLSLGRELIEKYTKVEQKELDEWIEKLYGPRMVPEGVLFALDAADADEVFITGEFTNWSREGIPGRRLCHFGRCGGAVTGCCVSLRRTTRASPPGWSRTRDRASRAA